MTSRGDTLFKINLILGILFSMKHVLSIVCNHLCALGPRFFSCSTSMSYMHAALLFLSAAIPFLYSSSLNADTNDGFPSTVGSAGHRSLAIDEYMVCDWVGVDQTRRFWRGRVVG